MERVAEPETGRLEIPLVGQSRASIELMPVGNAGKGGRIALGKITEGSCYYVAMFDHRCLWCRSRAPSWGGIDSVHIGGRTFPLIWVSTYPDGDSAKAFVLRYGLGGSAFAVASARTSKKLGVYATPSMWVIKDGRVLSTRESVRPELLRSAPTECTRDVHSP